MHDLKSRIWEKRSAKAAFFLLCLLLAAAVFAPWLSSQSPTEIDLAWKNTPPGSRFWLGSDELGRDIFTRLVWGARISFAIGFAAALLDACIGIAWGTAAAYFGGKRDAVLMRLADILSSIPHLLAVLLFSALLKPGFSTLLFSMTCTGWIPMARLVRSQVLHLKQLDYVTAAQIAGASFFHIARVHLFPNAFHAILASATLAIPAALFTEAFLSFIGLGVPAPFASWGVMINDGLSAMQYYPWRFFFPACAITLTILCFHILGNALLSALSPKERECSS